MILLLHLPIILGWLILSVIRIRNWYFPEDNLIPIWKQHFGIVAYLATHFVLLYFMLILYDIFRYLGVSDILLARLLLITFFCNTIYLVVLYTSKRKETQNSSPELKTVLQQIRIAVIGFLLGSLLFFLLAIYWNVI